MHCEALFMQMMQTIIILRRFTQMEKIKGFAKKCWAGVKSLWGKRNDAVNGVVGWCVFGGVLVVAVGLALIIWL